MSTRRYASFSDFWPYYVAMHSRRATRWIHLVGTGLGATVSLLRIATAQWALLVGLPVLGYAAAWPSHWLIERNSPASFGHPLWSRRGDLHMIATMPRGQDASLTATASTWLRTHPADRSAGSLRIRDLASA